MNKRLDLAQASITINPNLRITGSTSQKKPGALLTRASPIQGSLS
jgi:hypothetical protein